MSGFCIFFLEHCVHDINGFNEFNAEEIIQAMEKGCLWLYLICGVLEK